MNAATLVDHLVYATPDLDAGIVRIARLLGVEAVPGGRHPGRGTRNALLSLGSRSYLEIVGPDPDQPAAAPRWFRIDALQEPQLVTWATPVDDIVELAQRASAAGVELGRVGEGHRRRADGVELRWRFTDPAVAIHDGIVPFLIDWGSSPHPAASAPSAGELVSLRARHAAVEDVRRSLLALGRNLVVERGHTPALMATIRTSRGDVELR